MTSSKVSGRMLVISIFALGVLPVGGLVGVVYVFGLLQGFNAIDRRLFFTAFWSFAFAVPTALFAIGMGVRNWTYRQCDPKYRERPETTMAR